MTDAKHVKNIWVTRPEHRAHRVVEQLKAHQLNPLLVPALNITPLPDHPSIETYFQRLAEFDVSIFISADAAECIAEHPRIDSHLPDQSALPPLANAVAVGKQTAQKIHPAYQQVLSATNRIGDSHQLLKKISSELNLKRGASVAIIGGTDAQGTAPSPILQQAFADAGIDVHSVICYQRTHASPNREIQSLGEQGQISAAVCYSQDTLDAMLNMCEGQHQWLLKTPLFVIHPNIQHAALQRGFQHVIVVDDTASMGQPIANYLSKLNSPL